MLTGSLFAGLPRSRRLADSQLGRRVRAGIARAFPAMSDAERARVYRRLLSCDFTNRFVFKFHNAFPSLARLAARAVPVKSSRAIDALFASDEPLVIAGAHLGPVFFSALIARMLVPGRTVYTLHAERTANGPPAVRFMNAVGIVPVLDDRMATRTLLRALKHETRPAVCVGFDHLAVGTRMVPFLGSRIPVSDGVAYLADQAGAAIVALMPSFEHGLMHVTLHGPFRVDPALPAQTRREAVVNELYRVLEPYVAAAPEQWSEWAYLAPDVT